MPTGTWARPSLADDPPSQPWKASENGDEHRLSAEHFHVPSVLTPARVLGGQLGAQGVRPKEAFASGSHKGKAPLTAARRAPRSPANTAFRQPPVG